MILCILGCSGSGKTTLACKLEESKKFKRIITYTTRKPRDSEVDGKDYYFVTAEEIAELHKNNKLIEIAKFGNNYYGTPIVDINSNNWVIVVEKQGYKEIKDKYGSDVLGIYLDVSKKEVVRRLESEGKSKEYIESRISRDQDIENNIKQEVDYIINANNSIEEVYESVKEKSTRLV